MPFRVWVVHAFVWLTSGGHGVDWPCQALGALTSVLEEPSSIVKMLLPLARDAAGDVPWRHSWLVRAVGSLKQRKGKESHSLRGQRAVQLHAMRPTPRENGNSTRPGNVLLGCSRLSQSRFERRRIS